MEKMMTVNQVAKLAGISIRTLHYYDQIRLLKPKIKTDSKYRLYDEEDLEKLWQILFFKELEIPLSQIKEIISNPKFDKDKALNEHKELLLKKRKRIDRIITSIDKTVERGFEINMIKIFNNEDYEKYKEEAIKKYGDVAKESYNRTSKYSKDEWQAIQDEANKIFGKIAENMEKGAEDGTVQGLIEEWKNYITKYYYDCTLEIFNGLGQLYIEDERFTKNIDKTREGLASFMNKAIEYYCKNNS